MTAKASSTEKRGNILCVASNFPLWQGDTTTPFVLHLVQDLQNIGWNITVLAPHAPGALLEDWLGGVHVLRFRYLWPERLQTVCYQGGMLINLRKTPLDYLKIPFFLVAEILHLFMQLRSKNFDLLHSHCILPQGFCGVLASLPFGIPHVTTVHGSDALALKGSLFNWCKRFTLRLADAVTVNSSVTERAVQAIYPTTPLLRRIPMGVNVSLKPPLELEVRKIKEQYRKENGPLLIFIGRLIEEKGVDDLLHAMSIAITSLPNISAMIIGEGQDRMRFERTTQALGLKQHVSFIGWIDAVDIPTYLAAADIFIGPSRQSREGWVEAQGLTFLEAMAAHTPVIASRSGGIVDSVLHEKTGLLVHEHDPEGIAQAIIRLVDNPALTEHLRKTAYIWVKDNFSRQSSAAQFSRLFESLINDKKVAAKQGY